MEYNKFKYLYPPRPKNQILPGMLEFYEKRKWWAQIKKNGTCSIICVSPDKTITHMTRHNDMHKMWTPSKEVNEPLLQLPNKWYYFCGELINSKVPGIRNKMYLFDCLVCDNEYLIGAKYNKRYNILKSLFRVSSNTSQYDIVNDNVWIANNYNIGFEAIYRSLSNPEDEGIVIKDPNANLEACRNDGCNSSWQAKCRR